MRETVFRRGTGIGDPLTTPSCFIATKFIALRHISILITTSVTLSFTGYHALLNGAVNVPACQTSNFHVNPASVIQ